MEGERFEDGALYFGSEVGRFGAELGDGGVGRDTKNRRGSGSARSARVDGFGSAVVGAEAPNGCAECLDILC